MTKIVVTGAGAVLGQGIIKSLKSAPFEYQVIAVDPNPLSPGLYWADSHDLVPMASSEDYCSAIEAILENERPDAVLVGTDVELDIFARNRTEWEERFDTKIVVSPPETIRTADDKLETARWLEANGLPFPRSVPAERPDEVAALTQELGFPLVVKPRVGARAVGVELVRDQDELTAATRGREGLVVQEWAGPDNEEYTAGVICFDGNVEASIVLRRDLRDGNTFRAYADHYPDCDAYVRRVAKALKPFGPANLQFRRGLDGEFRLFEINARFSGTTPMRALLGFNEVHMVLQKLLNGTPITQPPVTKGTVVRFLEEQLLPTDLAEANQAAA
ncbi:MAG: ATP-grasp domain-containing protein [Erythrobacter sp.]|uniref:ATP-grasp domain-containing protein n=1 Tax=Erythrobacter sp. TaxID=1042 RepID=UPI00262B2F30|nr:ATP-grasp domain-containing protein [Erythrobacter sp.]MDJ0978681.1 ATP-grasp domain-containing protein [Erythrobacter sp.]